MTNYKHLNVKPKTFDLVMQDCVAIFLEDNPEFKGINITQEFIVARMVKFYLKG